MSAVTADATPREGKELIDATRPWASEDAGRTAWGVVSTLLALSLAESLALRAPHPALRLTASVVAGLVIVRGFILYHDVMHGALLRGRSLAARVGRGFFNVYGVLVLTPPVVWRTTHNYHHAHTAKLVGSHIGSYLMLTPEMYRKATPAQQRMYRLVRHPLNMLLGYLTVFLWGMCLGPFLRDRRKHWDSGVALVVHALLVALVTWRLGAAAALTGVVLPLAVACAMGAYLFYAQHNFPDVRVQPRETWSYSKAATESSSYMEMSPVMHWFTGNIGYHHVHHLNPQIPFYKLPSAMAGVPELQDPPRTSLRFEAVLACFRCKLWDPSRGRMIAFEELEAR